jgi:hypothetical protein
MAVGLPEAAEVGVADAVVVIGRQIDTAVAKDWAGHVVLDLPAAEWSIAKNDAFSQRNRCAPERILGIVDYRGKSV